MLMKKVAVSFYSLIACISLFAQTQYDYYEDGVAHQKPFITGDTLWGLIVLLAIIFIVWLIKSSISTAQQSVQESKRKAEAERTRQTKILREKQNVPVDLGLSVMWAPCNIGANSMTNSGKFYAWGEIKEHYRFTHGLEGDASTIGDISGKPQYDIARYDMGPGWRMPTLKEGIELIEKCQWQKVSNDDQRGYNVIGPNGNSIFLPFTGLLTSLMSTLEPHYDVSTSYYWLSTPFGDKYASVLVFDMEETVENNSNNPMCETKTFRNYGFCVRAVKDY